jgi:aspartate racemase
VLLPGSKDRAYVHDRYMGELIEGKFRSETRSGIVAVIDRLKQEGAEGVLLGGTELPLLLRGAEISGVPLLDTARIHVRRAGAELLSPD